MLVFNPYSFEVEHFEPHGDKYMGQYIGHVKGKGGKTGKNGYWEPEGIDLKGAVKVLNEELKEYLKGDNSNIRSIKAKLKSRGIKGVPKLKYLAPNDICPAGKT